MQEEYKAGFERIRSGQGKHYARVDENAPIRHFDAEEQKLIDAEMDEMIRWCETGTIKSKEAEEAKK